MAKEMEFFVFLLEQYAYEKGVSSDNVLDNWDNLGLTDYIYGMYERYHSEALENAFEDIDRLTAERKSVKDIGL